MPEFKRRWQVAGSTHPRKKKKKNRGNRGLFKAQGDASTIKAVLPAGAVPASQDEDEDEDEMKEAPTTT